MSYILDALRRSESERRQGKVPDLGQQVQFVHKPRKKSSSLVAWIAGGLVLNAAVLAFVLWPTPTGTQQPEQPEPRPEAAAAPALAPEPVPVPQPESEPQPQPQQPEPLAKERPTVIVPSRLAGGQSPSSSDAEASSGPVPHLVEMPRGFQQSIPDLVFNSHIYASEPSSRRVMINNNYLKAGDSFDGIKVQQITEEGVVLSRNGQSFRVGSMRDWVSPN